MRDKILAEIDEIGYFLLSPDRFDEFTATVLQMQREGILTTYYARGQDTENSCYYYIRTEDESLLGG